jgi:hypothetical protein
MDLRIHVSYSRPNHAIVDRVTGFMASARFFNVAKDLDMIPPGVDVRELIHGQIREQLDGGGYTLLFWSHAVHFDIPGDIIADEVGWSHAQYRDRVLPILLDDRPLPEMLRDQPAIRLSSNAVYDHEEPRSVEHRIDDIIVRLYWLIYRNTRQNKHG